MDLSDSRAPNFGTCFGILRRFVIPLSRNGSSDWLFKRIAGIEEWAAECTVYGMRRHWLSIVVITASATSGYVRAIAESGPFPGGRTVSENGIWTRD